MLVQLGGCQQILCSGGCNRPTGDRNLENPTAWRYLASILTLGSWLLEWGKSPCSRHTVDEHDLSQPSDMLQAASCCGMPVHGRCQPRFDQASAQHSDTTVVWSPRAVKLPSENCGRDASGCSFAGVEPAASEQSTGSNVWQGACNMLGLGWCCGLIGFILTLQVGFSSWFR